VGVCLRDVVFSTRVPLLNLSSAPLPDTTLSLQHPRHHQVNFNSLPSNPTSTSLLPADTWVGEGQGVLVVVEYDGGWVRSGIRVCG
jgi:hypothetical protein